MENLIGYVIGVFLTLFFQSCNFQRTYTWPNGSKYVGELINGKPHGQGTQTIIDGAVYVGEFKNGLRHGQGTYTFTDGEKYTGGV